jgi:hypothetical protein
VTRINVLVVTTSPDLKAQVIAESVASRSDMTLVKGRCVSVPEIDGAFDDTPPSQPRALILVGQDGDTNELIRRLLAKRADLVVVYVDVFGPIVAPARPYNSQRWPSPRHAPRCLRSYRPDPPMQSARTWRVITSRQGLRY